jgi:DNA-binding NarL/FixJ family response regulator
MIKLLLVEDNPRLREALKIGFEKTGQVLVCGNTDNGESAVEMGIQANPDAVLMDVRLAGSLNGIQAATALRREIPRLPVVFYSIQDDDQYYVISGHRHSAIMPMFENQITCCQR